MSDLHDAHQTLHTADSLKAAGGQFDDSLSLSSAATTLHKVRLLYPTDYLRASYHYGRLLRSHNNEIDAMQWFIRGSHSPSREHQTKARVFSNMRSMAHLAGEFRLSSDMYERCSELFLKAKDTLMYYHALNSMAFELAELKEKEQSFALLSSIEQNCPSDELQQKVWETRAALYFNTAQFDSAIYYVDRQQLSGVMSATCGAIKAASLWNLQQYDSAYSYAARVMQLPDASAQDKYNMLFIVSNDTANTCDAQRGTLAGNRVVLDKYEIDPQHNRLAVAVELLQQDIAQSHHRALYILLYVLALAAIIGALIAIYASIKIRDKRFHELKNDTEQIEHRHSLHRNRRLQEVETTCSAIRQSPDWQQVIGWKNYDKMCEIVNKNFYLLANKLKNTGKLNESEIRLCVLVLIGGFSSKQMAGYLNYAESGIRNYKQRIAQKLGTSSKNLRLFLLDLAIGS